MKTASWAAVFLILVSAGSLRAHHSSGMFDLTQSVWVSGTVVEFQVINPHAVMVVETTAADGAVEHWTIEGPHPARFSRVRELPEIGDVIGVCGFLLREEIARRGSNPYGTRTNFLHGHTVQMPDGHWEIFGSYGTIAECIQESDATYDSWLSLLNNGGSSIREMWCRQRDASRRVEAAGTELDFMDVIDEINALMARPCT